jgi:glucosamine 6-phosphate synthetase-like amidotransferase/phosphosugar isomerase protein
MASWAARRLRAEIISLIDSARVRSSRPFKKARWLNSPGSARRAPAGVRLIVTPGCDDIVAPLVYAVPIQMLAYYVAVQKGADVDQPRNLAKSVTVE